MSNTTFHFLCTWLLAHAIHPFMWMIGSMMLMGGLEIEGVLVAIPGSMIVMVFSFPAIFLFKLVGNGIFKSSLLPGEKFILWLVAAPLITMINAVAFTMLMVLLVLGSPFFYSEVLFWFALPSIVATVVSVIIRYPQFFKLNDEIMAAKQIA